MNQKTEVIYPKHQLKLIRHCFALICLALLVLLSVSWRPILSAQKTAPSQGKPKIIRLDQQSTWRPESVKAEVVDYKGKHAVRVTDAAPLTDTSQKRLLLLSGTDFRDGVIELEMAGEPGPNASADARGFVGIAFRIASDVSKFECFYIRPTNGRADDQLRRNHSAQYVAHPDYPWERLRREFPGKYESYTDLVPAEWTKVRVEVRGGRALLYVNGAQQPTLLVNDLKLGESSSGGIGLWVGPGTIAHFTGLSVSQ